MVSITLAKPIATVTIQPTGRGAAGRREHSIHVILKLSASQPRYADTNQVAGVARRALAGFRPANGEPDQRRFGEVSETSKSRKTGTVSTVVGVEGSAPWSGRPGDDSVESLRDALLGEGYRVTVRERRGCAEPECKAGAIVDWFESSEVPVGWHSNLICGGHNYRTCPKCKSVYALSSTNSVGAAPSVHCEVCGRIIIEWGSSKIWSAQLVTRAGI